VSLKTLGRATPPLSEPIADPRTGRLTDSWARYLMRLPLTFSSSDTNVSSLTSTVAGMQVTLTVHSAALTTLDGRVDQHDVDLAALGARLDAVEEFIATIPPDKTVYATAATASAAVLVPGVTA